MRRRGGRWLAGVAAAAWLCGLAAACGGGGGGPAPETLPASYPGKKIVFVTSQAGTGDLVGWRAACSGRSTGLEAADCLCDEHARRWGGLSGTYRAWLSDGTQTAAARLTHAALPYVNRRGEDLAGSWMALVDLPCTPLIGYDESGAPVGGAGLVWTGSTADGGAGPAGRTCNGWRSGGAGSGGSVGSTRVDPVHANFPGCWSEWGQGGAWRACDDWNHLYCFEQ